MKKFIVTTLAIVAVITTFSSCDLLDKADDVTFDVQFKVPTSFEVSEEAENPVNPYTSLQSTMDVDNPQYDQYKNKIKDVTINKIEYTISNFSADGPVTLTSGEAIFFGTGETIAAGKIASVTNKALSNHTGELQASAAALEEIEKIIFEDGEVFVVSRATLSDAPVFFNVNVTIHATIKANALD
ncbi:MAG TPA: hypothetical protein VGD40_12295 [Chryseosolibacter sp.]